MELNFISSLNNFQRWTNSKVIPDLDRGSDEGGGRHTTFCFSLSHIEVTWNGLHICVGFEVPLTFLWRKVLLWFRESWLNIYNILWESFQDLYWRCIGDCYSNVIFYTQLILLMLSTSGRKHVDVCDVEANATKRKTGDIRSCAYGFCHIKLYLVWF
jgi:hypothetical protein